MDIFAHGLWAGAGGAAANLKLKTRLRPLEAAAWGMFPDVFAFLPIAAVVLWLRRPGEPIGPGLLFHGPQRDLLPRFLRPEALYQFSHSLLVFLAVFLVARLLLRRPLLAMLGWPLHILMDIPTHGGGVYRTPFLWPLSSYRFSGIWWSRPWFMILNYSLIASAYIALLVCFLKSRRKRKESEKTAGPGQLQ